MKMQMVQEQERSIESKLDDIPRYECNACGKMRCGRTNYSLRHILEHPCFSDVEPVWVEVKS
jgi:hypothetical protein